MTKTESIGTYEDLLAEKSRLEMLILNQKNIVRHDLDELKAVFKKEIKPALDSASLIRKIIAPKNRPQTLITLGTSIAIDVVFTSLFGKSNLLIRAFVPRLMKNYAGNLLRRWAEIRRRNALNPKPGQGSKQSTTNMP